MITWLRPSCCWSSRSPSPEISRSFEQPVSVPGHHALHHHPGRLASCRCSRCRRSSSNSRTSAFSTAALIFFSQAILRVPQEGDRRCLVVLALDGQQPDQVGDKIFQKPLDTSAVPTQMLMIVALIAVSAVVLERRVRRRRGYGRDCRPEHLSNGAAGHRLNDVTLTVPAGITGLLGRTAGQSTLMEADDRQLKPSQGSIRVLGEPICGNPPLYCASLLP